MLLYSRPTRGMVQLARQLRAQFGSRLHVLSESDAGAVEVSGADVAMFVVGDVRPDRLSRSLLAALSGPHARRVMLPSSLRFSWPFALPVTGGVNGVQAQHSSLALRVPKGMYHEAFAALGEVRIPVRRLAVVRARPGAAVLLEAAGGNVVFPFAVSDDQREPRTLVVLGDSMWRWSMSPKASIRACYAVAWRQFLSLLSEEGAGELGLELSLASAPGTDVGIAVRVPASVPDPRRLHVEVKLSQGEGPASRQSLVFDDARGFFAGSAKYTALGEVLWVHAVARGGGETYRSERKPVFREAFRREHALTVPSMESVRGIATDPGSGSSSAEGAEEVVAKLLEELPVPPVSVGEHERSFRLEMLLAVLLVLLLGLEWGIERTLHGGA